MQDIQYFGDFMKNLPCSIEHFSLNLFNSYLGSKMNNMKLLVENILK